MVVDLNSRRRSPGIEAVLNAFSDVSTVEEAKARVASIAAACRKPRPRWYREDRAGDSYAATLASGEVLAWSRLWAGEPLELMAWSDAFQGSIIWRERT